MKSFFIFIIIWFCLPLASQTYQWGITDTSYQWSSGASIAIDTADNMAISETLGDDKNIDVVKYDANHNVLWRKRINSFLIEYSDVAMDKQGNVYFTAGFYTYIKVDGIQYNGAYSGSTHMVLVKFNPQGSVQWVKHTTGGGAFGRGISIDKRDNIYVIGSAGGTANFGNMTANAGLFIVKYNSNGVAQWVRSTSNGDGGSGDGPKIKTSKSGNIYISGLLYVSTNFGTHAVSPYGSSDVYIAKLDSSGNWLWAKAGGGIYEEWLYGLDVDDNDNAYITGYFHSPTATFGAISFSNTSNEDYFLAKYDSNGNTLWAKGGVKSFQTNSFCVDEAGNSYMVSHGTFLRKHDFNGSYMWHTLKNIHNAHMVSDKKGGVYITGNITTTATFGSATLTPTKMQQMFIAKLYDPAPVTTGLKETIEQSLFQVFPNPTNQYVTIYTSEAVSKGVLKITNSLGQLVHSEILNNNADLSNKINISHLAKGLYIVELTNTSDNSKKAQKLIIE